MFEWLKNWFGYGEPKSTINVDTNAQIIHHRIDDPTVPLMVDLPIPKPLPALQFRVLGYIGGGHPIDSLEGQAANLYLALVNCSKVIQTYLSKPFKGWAATSALVVQPRAGQDLNAYYDRRNLKFFYMPDPKLHKTVYAADSSTVTTHELGHAILDSVRPDLWSLQVLETMSFHEAYGDINAMIGIMSYPETIDYVLKETGGNLRQSNMVSKLAKELGTALYDLAGVGKPGVLRDAVNDFKYTTPENLPQDGPDNQLIAEPHSFGRLMMGAWYDMFVGFYELECKTSSPADAIAKARDTAAKYILAGMIQAPASRKFYEAVARAMINWGKINGKPEYNDIITKVFTARKILSPQIKMLRNVQFQALNLLPNDQILHLGNNKVVKRTRIEKLILSNELGLMALDFNPLFHAEIEVPRDVYMEFDENGNLIDEISDTRDEIVEAARKSLVRLHQKGLVGSTDKTEFELQENKLVRTKFID